MSQDNHDAKTATVVADSADEQGPEDVHEDASTQADSDAVNPVGKEQDVSDEQTKASTSETAASTESPSADASSTQPAATVKDTASTPAASTPASKSSASSKDASTTSARSAAPARQGRRARLILTRVDPWSVMKLSFLLSIAAALVTVVSTMLVWIVLKSLNVFDSLNENIGSMLSGGTGGTTFDLSAYLSFSRWLGLATLTGVLNVFLITAIATLTAFLYNIATSLVGGVQVTLSD